MHFMLNGGKIMTTLMKKVKSFGKNKKNKGVLNEAAWIFSSSTI